MIMNKKTFRDLPIGETFNLGVHKLKVKETEKPCKDCYILKTPMPACDEFCEEGYIPECVGACREDKKMVVFVEVEE